MRGFNFDSWEAALTTIVGLALVTLIGVGIRLLTMQLVQQRRERENRQINERLRTLIAAYRTLGGSFTGDIEVDPAHRRELRRRGGDATGEGSDRARRIRDAVEAALSDILLLGTDEQVRLAARAASDLAAGRKVRTTELVVSLRAFIRDVLDLEPVPTDLEIPHQGPTRPGGGGGGKGRGEGARDGGDRGERGGGRGGGGAGAAGAGGLGIAAGLHLGGDHDAARDADEPSAR